MANILIINGPNLNLLGTREPEVYGATTLEEINASLMRKAQMLHHQLHFFQSAAEHEIVAAVHQAKQDQIDYLIINAGALTHTSIALRDALLGVAIPFVEVHLSNVKARESFRRHSYLEDIANGCIFGFGALGYHLALIAIDQNLSQTT